MVIIMDFLIILTILLVILIVLIRKKKTFGHALRYLVPAYLLMIAAYIILRLEIFLSLASFGPIVYFVLIILLVVCAGAGAFLHNQKTYILGFIAASILVFFGSLNVISGVAISVMFLIYLIFLLIFLLILCVLGFVFDKAVMPKSASTQTPASPSILCLSGMFAGAEFSLNGEESITFGSSPLHSQIILSGTTIKETHCKVWFDQDTATWCIIDYSDGATYLNETQPLIKDQLYQVKQGTSLSLGNGPDKQQFKLL